MDEINYTFRVIGFVILGIVLLGAIAWVLGNLRKAKPELGSEIELAANRRPYYSDEELEGKKLDRSLGLGLVLLVVTAIALPLYWLAEPGRQSGAVETFEETFVSRGEELYLEGAQCVNCHGPEGSGGVASFIITDENGEFVDQVSWKAPALDTVLYRFSEDEVEFVLNYGRPGTPMAAWGVPGGGPLTSQQVDNLIDYMWSIQLSPEEVREQLDGAIEAIDPELHEAMLRVREARAGGDASARLAAADEIRLGEILFNLDTAAGAYSCARCHIPGWSYGKAGDAQSLATGRIGPSLNGIQDALTWQQHYDLVNQGSELGVRYGANGQGSGKMPGFGVNANAEDEDISERFGQAGLLTPEQIEAVVAYERQLDQNPNPADVEVRAAAARAAEQEEGS